MDRSAETRAISFCTQWHIKDFETRSDFCQ